MPEGAVTADIAGGTLRLPRRLLVALAAVSADPPVAVDPDDLDALRTAGLVQGEAVHPDVAAVAAAVARPAVRLRLDRLAPPPAVECAGWIAPGIAVLALPLPDGGDQVLAMPAADVAAQLAALAGLGPRPVAPDGSPPPQSPRLRWRVEARWFGEGGVERARSVEAIDGAGRGWWLLGPATEPPAARPTSATALFRLLCRLLPTDGELG